MTRLLALALALTLTAACAVPPGYVRDSELPAGYVADMTVPGALAACAYDAMRLTTDECTCSTICPAHLKANRGDCIVSTSTAPDVGGWRRAGACRASEIDRDVAQGCDLPTWPLRRCENED